MLSTVFKTGALMAVLSTLAVAAPTAQSVEVVKRSGAPGCHDQEFIDTALGALNHHRQLHGSPPLEWDHTLAEFAQGVSNKCQMVHSGGPYGENLFGMGPPPEDYISETTSATMAWAQEIWTYDWSNPGSGALHATALLWRSTKKVGCAWAAPCNNGAIYTCEFGESVPNMGGEYQDNVFPLHTKVEA